MIWSNLGINYNFLGSGASSSADLQYLYRLGFRKIRLLVADYNDSVNIASYRTLVQTAIGIGFTTIIYGLTSNPTQITASNWPAFKAALEAEATWCQSLGSSAVWFNMGNEEEIHVDGTTITATTIQSNLATEATTIKGIYTMGKVIYTVGQVGTDYTRWKNNLGLIDYLGVNLYDFNNVFQSSLTQLVSDLGSKAFLSEFGYLDESGTDMGGYCDFNDEDKFRDTMAFRLNAVKNSGIQSGFIYSFMDSVNCMGNKLTNGNFRTAWPSLIGLRPWFFKNPNQSVISFRSVIARSQITRNTLITRPLF